MKHGLLRLRAKLHNTPHLITADALAPILEYFDARSTAGFERIEWEEADSAVSEDEKPYADGLGVLRVDGSLTYKPVMTMCGEAGTSYVSLVRQVEEMAAAGVRTIVMEVSSPGGEASHCFQTADEIRSICNEHGIRLIGYADTIAASGGYALIAICDEVIANPDATLGSIGVVVALTDVSKAYEKAGVKRIFITSGANKVPFAADGSFKEEFLAELQTHVDQIADKFAQHVSTYTGLDVDTIKGLEAGVFVGQEAVDKGLANKVMTNKEFATYVAALHKGIYFA